MITVWILLLVTAGSEINKLHGADQPWSISESSMIFLTKADCDQTRETFYRGLTFDRLGTNAMKFSCKPIRLMKSQATKRYDGFYHEK